MGKYLFIILAGLSFNGTAFAINKNVQDSDSQVVEKSYSWVTTRIAEIAHSDLQVRLLMKMFSNKTLDSESYFNELQKLQSNSK